MATEITDIASDVAELAVDVKDLAVEQSERVVTVVKHNPRLAIVVGVVGFAAGAFAGFKYAEKLLTEKFEERLEEEILTERKAAQKVAKLKQELREPVSPTKVFRETANSLDEARKILQERGYSDGVVVEEVVTETTVTLDGEPLDDDFDYADELSRRDPEFPYIITHDEFLENTPEYTQVTLTWYAGDNILSDERDEPIENLNYTIGAENLDRFGHGSRDSNIVYVRNEKLDLDFEIQRSLGSYAVEVLNYTQEERTARALAKRVKHGDD